MNAPTWGPSRCCQRTSVQTAKERQIPWRWASPGSPHGQVDRICRGSTTCAQHVGYWTWTCLLRCADVTFIPPPVVAKSPTGFAHLDDRSYSRCAMLRDHWRIGERWRGMPDTGRSASP